MKPTILVLLALVSACAGRQKPSELIDDVRVYGDGLRWQKLTDAAAHVPARERADFLSEREDLVDDLRIGDWEVERIEWQSPGRRALVRVEWTWHLDSRGIVHKTISEQRWELHGKSWLMVGEARRRGEPMPGVPEPAPEAPERAGRSAAEPAAGG